MHSCNFHIWFYLFNLLLLNIDFIWVNATSLIINKLSSWHNYLFAYIYITKESCSYSLNFFWNWYILGDSFLILRVIDFNLKLVFFKFHSLNFISLISLYWWLRFLNRYNFLILSISTDIIFFILKRLNWIEFNFRLLLFLFYISRKACILGLLGNLFLILRFLSVEYFILYMEKSILKSRKSYINMKI